MPLVVFFVRIRVFLRVFYFLLCECVWFSCRGLCSRVCVLCIMCVFCHLLVFSVYVCVFGVSVHVCVLVCVKATDGVAS